MEFNEKLQELRKKKGVTQEQAAQALNVSPQAVSKWETNTSQPDVQMLPLIADYFGVSIDYLYYGKDLAYGEIYDKIFQKVAEHDQMSQSAYEELLTVFGMAHHGVTHGSLRGRDLKIYDSPSHTSGEQGLSLLSGKGYGAVLTRAFFEQIDRGTAEFAAGMLSVLAERNCLLVCMAIISMSGISFGELQEKLQLDEPTLRMALDRLITAQLVVETKSKHLSLGLTYEISGMYHTCLCILLATIEMQRYSLNGISCCMGFGDYPIQL